MFRLRERLMKSEPNNQDMFKAYDWYERHSSDIEWSVVFANGTYSPMESKCNQPALWKSEHWKWALSSWGIALLAKDRRRLIKENKRLKRLLNAALNGSKKP